MAIMPLKQTVTIFRKGETDRWGNPITDDETFTLKCRVDEGAKLTRRTSAQTGMVGVLAEEIVSSARFYFDKFANVRLTDELHFEDEAGNTTTYLPLNINRIRGLNGKVMLTEVEV